MFKNKRNYFLIALILIAFCVVGLLIAQSANQMLGNKVEVAQAQKDCLTIAKALLHFYRDTGKWPYYNSSWMNRYDSPQVDYLYGNMGDMPGFAAGVGSSWGNVGVDMIFSLTNNGDEYNGEQNHWYKPKPKDNVKGTPYPLVGWNGPYLKSIADPWGCKYLVSVNGLKPMGKIPSNNVWCLSAGPNNIVDTPAWSTNVKGDDIGYRAE